MRTFTKYLKSNAIALLALFVALGGVSYAAIKLPANSVGSAQLKKNAVTLTKVAPSARSALKGSRGERGLDGAAGKNGTNGSNGANGTNGTNGKDGAPGTARAYATIAGDGTLNADLSKGFVQSNIVHDAVNAPGTYCFTGLSFTPKNVMANTEGWDQSVHIHYGEAPGICANGTQLVATVRTAGHHIDGPFSLLVAD